MAQTTEAPAIEARGIVKVYPDGVVALKGVDLVVRRGEIHALLGENGAGKTTLMRILYGEIQPTKGEIRVFGQPVRFKGPWDAMRAGIGMVYQHFTLVARFTVMENLRLSQAGAGLPSEPQAVRAKAEELMQKTGLKVPLDAVVEDLPVGVQQRVEILKALMRDVRILILDEPTSVLTPVETKYLFEVLKGLRERGITIIFITHKLREVKAIADRVTVMRRGRVVATVDVASVTEADLARMMVGREVVLRIEKTPAKPKGPVLVVKDLWVKDDRGLDAVKGVNLEVRAGEIVGIAGVQGNGQRELAEAIAGVRKPFKGQVLLAGKDVTGYPPHRMYREGLAYIPDSRKVGLILDFNIVENVALTNRHLIAEKGLMRWGKATKLAADVVKRFAVVAESLKSPIKYLSGGNQQKVMVGREVIREPKVIIASEPTHGLDVGATEYIRKLLIRLRDEGAAVLLISTDLDEILQLSDRVAVIFDGRIVSVKPTEEYTIEELGLLMGGAVPESKESKEVAQA